MDIFDTSAIRGMGRAKLARIAASRAVAVSPITAYELLCHLDEPPDEKFTSKQAVFDNRKGELLKLKGFQILHDPHAAHAIAIDATAVTNPNRFKDAQLVPLLIEKLESATTLEDFYSQTIIDAEGRQYSVADCAEKARQALKSEEERFARLIDDIRKDFSKKLNLEGEKNFTEKEIFDEINKWCDKLTNSYKSNGIETPDLTKKVLNSMYVHYGYSVARTLFYMSKTKKKYDLNDMEDAAISLHLALDRNDILVTNDRGTSESIGRALEAFKQCADGQTSARCKVITPELYQQEITDVQ